MPTNDQHCRFAGCPEAVVCSLEEEAFCYRHFISVCQTRLERCDKQLKSRKFGAGEDVAMRRFVEECTRNVNQIEQRSPDLPDEERNLLLKISVWANDLGRQIRRSPRIAAAISICVRGEDSNGPWEEYTKTILLSRYGASCVCRRNLKAGDIVHFERVDTGEKAQAKVAWHSPTGEEGVRMAVEFIGCDNFWKLDWNAAAKA